MKHTVFGRATHKPGVMNKTEKAYAKHLDLRIAAGEVLERAFEVENLRLAKRTFYKPDFRVIMADRTVEFHEVKGFWQDDALVKIKVAADLHPYVFRAVEKTKDGWRYREF